jgi:hypothetical protein
MRRMPQNEEIRRKEERIPCSRKPLNSTHAVVEKSSYYTRTRVEKGMFMPLIPCGMSIIPPVVSDQQEKRL